MKVNSAAALATARNHEIQIPGAEYLEHLGVNSGQLKDSSEDVLFLSADPKMQQLKEIVLQIADANVPVLITGESGTGKEIVAQAIHKASGRKNKDFVAVNCAAVPGPLLESELFGFEKGAFTGANQRHLGKFQQADGGTLLLDEVTEIDSALQAKLLRAIQERKIERLGGSGPIPVDTRIIATSNRDMVQAVAQGIFRQDLYYRLYVIHLEIPPLRERPADIEFFSTYFLKKYSRQFGRTAPTLTSEARKKLAIHPWRGNVRELENVMQRVVLMTQGEIVEATQIQFGDKGDVLRSDWIGTLPIGRSLREIETQFILKTLEHHEGNRTHAARTLGISLRTLRNKINEFSADGMTVIGPGHGRQ